jgi:arylsulfatase A-like enzyme
VVNVLLITTDQHKATTLGAYGDPLGATPHLDRLATQGTTFTCARTLNPFCQPARATMITGQHPSTHGVVRNGIDLPAEAGADSVATLLGAAGYTSALIGKAHFASYYPDFPTGSPEAVVDSALVPDDWFGPYFGFDHVELVTDVHNIRLARDMGAWNWGFGPPPFGLHYARHLYRDGVERGRERLRLMQPEAAGRTWDATQSWPNQLDEQDHPTTWTADRAIDWLRTAQAGDRPWFCWASFADPHHPFDPPRPWCDRYTPDDVAEVIAAPVPGDLDGKPAFQQAWSQGFRGTQFEWANPGWATLTDDQRRTIVASYYGMVAQLDHNIGRVLAAVDQQAGDTLVVFTADHGDYLGDHQLMLKGPIHYEALVRVPLIVRGPAVPVGEVVTNPVGTVDLAPTFLEHAGVAVPDTIEGRSLFAPTPREHVLTEDEMVRGFLQSRTLTTESWRVTRDLNDPDGGELYDRTDDPGEVVNRWNDPDCAAIRDELLTALHDTMRHDLGRDLPQVCEAG